jgi:hypothetical protein
MRIVAASPLRTGSVVWQEQPGQYTLTVVCKATYALGPLTAPLLADPDEVNERDNHWDDDPQRSLYLPSDLAPFKPQPEVILVGSAFAPRAQPVRSLHVRLVVGEVDKSIEVFCPRVWMADGTLRDGPRWTQMPLRYERAAGGPGSWNPVGIGADAVDRYGRRAVPNLQLPGVAVSEPGDVIHPCGLGPIAPTWPSRRERLRDRAARWSDARWSEEPLGDGFDGAFFQVAPADQRLDAIRPDEQIILENLSQEHPRLVTKLCGARPHAQVEAPGEQPWELTLVADTLWIDTQRGVCTVTWRGQVPLDTADQPGLVRIGVEEAGRALRWPSSDAPPPPAAPDESDVESTVTDDAALRSAVAYPRPVLPFQAGAAKLPAPSAAALSPKRAAVPVLHDGVVDEPTNALRTQHGSRGAMPAWLENAKARPALPPTPAYPPPAAPTFAAPPPAATSAVFTAPRVEGIRTPPPPPPPVPLHLRQSDPFLGATAAPRVPAPPPSTVGLAPLDGGDHGRVDAASAAYAGVLEASNAAADPQAGGKARRGAGGSGAAPRAMIELIWHDPQKVSRMRATPAWQALLAEPAATAAPAEGDAAADKRAAEEAARAERADVVAVLGQALATLDVEGVMIDAASEDGGLEPPLVLVAGELELGLDEVKMLEAMLGAAAPLSAGDKKVKEVIDLASEVMRTPLGASPGVAAGFITRLREAWNKAHRILPADYLEVHTRRLLLEQRSYQKRDLWSDSFLRAVIAPAGEGSGIPAYLPASLAKQLPLFARFPARLVAEAFPQQDQAESCPVALRVVALGRVVTARRR